MKKLVLIFLVLGCQLFLAAQKKVEIIPSSIQGIVGSQISVPIVLTGFSTDTTSLVAVEFYLVFDNTVLTFDSVSKVCELLPQEEWFFSEPDPTSNRFSCNWVEPSFITNVSIPDGTTLFEIVFTYNGGESNLEYEVESSLFVHLDPDFNFVTLQVEFSDGNVIPAPNTNTTFWNGNGDWNTIQNWSQGIPTIESNAIIETGLVNIQNTVGSARNLEIMNGTIVKILPQFSLTIADSLINDGVLQVLSDESGTGSLIINKAVSGAGNYQIEKFFTTGSHLIGSPLANSSIDVFENIQVEVWDQALASFSPMAAGTVMEGGIGYLFGIPDNTTVSFNGNELYQGDITLNLGGNGSGNAETTGYNLISNPYPSPIKWLSGDWDLQNTGKSIYVLDQNRYRTWNGYLGDLMDGVLPAMQGFFVKTTGENAQITIPNNARLHSNQPFYKETTEIENILTIEFGKLDGGNPGDVEDKIFLHFRAEATNGFDAEFDAYKMPYVDGATLAYSMLNDENFEKMAIDVRQIAGGKFPSVAIGFKPADEGIYYLRLKNVDSFDPDIPIVLQDLGLEVAFPDDEIDMRNNLTDFTYSFSTKPQDEQYRFNLHFSMVGIQDEFVEENIQMWISGDKLVIESNISGAAPVDLGIFDVMGRKILQDSFSVENSHQVDLSSVKGLFIVRLTNAGNVITKKFYR